jgi:hypothetical protein
LHLLRQAVASPETFSLTESILGIALFCFALVWPSGDSQLNAIAPVPCELGVSIGIFPYDSMMTGLVCPSRFGLPWDSVVARSMVMASELPWACNTAFLQVGL